jgi:hypothetical protein
VSYKYADESGNEVNVEPSIVRESCRVIARDLDLNETTCVVIPREDVPDTARNIAVAMHRSVDLQPPIILEPPPEHVPETITGLAGCIDVSRNWSAERPVTISIRNVSQPLSEEDTMRLALRLLAQLEAAKAAPELGMVHDLADLICVYGGAENGQRSARAILTRYELRERGE